MESARCRIPGDGLQRGDLMLRGYLALGTICVIAATACGSHQGVCGSDLQIDASTISFSATAGGSDPASKYFHVTNPSCPGMYCLPTPMSASSDSDWLTVSPQQATVGSSDVTVTVSAAVGALAAGTYTGHINVNVLKYCSSPVPTAITVTFTVAADSIRQ